jgi:N-acetylmuramic acid 6-phosphate etherase
MTQPSSTESINQATKNLDLLEAGDLVSTFIEDQFNAVQAVKNAAPEIARAVELAVSRLELGGRLIYAGAGTSGRLAFLDAAELIPTFSWSKTRALVAMAGGNTAVFQAVEGAEDNFDQGRDDVLAFSPTKNDVIIAIAASGTTPYALGALEAAKSVDALRIGISNNANAPILEQAEVGILLETGAEVISGSTRLKAGTAQKIALNTFSSSVMVRLHKVYGNLMVDLQATNIKLVKRAVRLTVLATNKTETQATQALESCGYHIKTAIVMLERNLNAQESEALLEKNQGNVRACLQL